MKNVFLETANVRAFREALSVLEDIEKGQPGLGVVWGRAGRGKTECAREFAVRTGAVYLRVLEDWTPRAMLSALCRQLNGSEPKTVDRCKRIACEILDRTRKTILVDEADRLDMKLVEHFRDLHDEAGIPVVLIGEEHLFPMLNARRRLWSRVTQTVEFGPITAEDIMLFGFKAAELKLEPAAAQKIGGRSGGDFRLVWQDIRDLEQMARAAGAKTASAAMIDALPARKSGPTPEKHPLNAGR
ncbi:MAG: ATP-binding protein [Desulfobacteraceae bacterium]|nr:ATP-binding protein [Desulfobacteraceae bacterium]